MRLTGVKIEMFSQRGRPSQGTMYVIVSPDQIANVVRQPGGLHLYMRNDSEFREYNCRKILNEADVEQVLIEAGLGHLIR